MSETNTKLDFYSFNEWMRENRPVKNETVKLPRGGSCVLHHVRPAIRLKDGTTISVQASEISFCAPREDDSPIYFSWEVGYPSVRIEELMPYAWNEDRPTETVYSAVPTEVLCEIINKRGGFAEEAKP